MDHHGQQAHHDVQPVTDEHDEDADDDQRPLEAERHVVKALRDSERRHADGKQSDVAHDVAEGADGVEEHCEGVAKARLETLREGLVRRHPAEAHDQHEAEKDHRGNGREVHLLADDEVEHHEVQRADRAQPAEVGDPAEVLLPRLAADVHHTRQRELDGAEDEAEFHDAVLLLGGGDVEILGVVRKGRNDQRAEQRHVHRALKPEPGAGHRAPDDGGDGEHPQKLHGVGGLFALHRQSRGGQQEQAAVARVADDHGEEEREEAEEPERNIVLAVARHGAENVEHRRDEPHPGLFQKIAILVRAEVRVHDVHIGECHAVPGRGGVQGEVEGEVGLPHSVMPRHHRDRRQREREPRSLICRHQMSPSGVFCEAWWVLSCSRMAARRILPLTVRGSSSTYSMMRGYL